MLSTWVPKSKVSYLDKRWKGIQENGSSKGLTFVRGIKTFLGIGNPCELAYSWAARSFACVKRVPSTKSANQKGRGKSFKRRRPACKYNFLRFYQPDSLKNKYAQAHK